MVDERERGVEFEDVVGFLGGGGWRGAGGGLGEFWRERRGGGVLGEWGGGVDCWWGGVCRR